MIYKRFGSKYLVRLERGEDIVQSIMSLCKEENIKLGHVWGIGAVDKAKIGYFEIATKEYHSKELTGDMEIVGLTGNISEMDEEVYLHLHISLADENYNVLGGHLNYARISATGEIIIDLIDGKVNREFNEEIGLNLIKF